MMIDWTISLGSILQILAILVGGITFAYALLFDVRQLKKDVQSLGTKVELIGTVMVNLAKVDGKFNTIETRLDRAESDISELRHGDGFVLPLVRSRKPGE